MCIPMPMPSRISAQIKPHQNSFPYQIDETRPTTALNFVPNTIAP